MKCTEIVRRALIPLAMAGALQAKAGLDWSVSNSYTSFGEFDSSHAGNERRLNYTIYNLSSLGDVNNLIQWVVPAGTNQGVYKALCDSNPEDWTTSIEANQTIFTGIIVPGGDELFKVFTSYSGLGSGNANAYTEQQIPFDPISVNVPVSVTAPAITNQPQSILVQEGSSTNLNVGASGSPSSYQRVWDKSE